MWAALVILALAGASDEEAREKGSEQKAPDGAFDILGLRLGIPADMAAKDAAIEGAKVSERAAVQLRIDPQDPAIHPLGSAINISNADDFSSVEGVLVGGREAEPGKEYLRAVFSYGDSPNVILVRRVHRYPVQERGDGKVKRDASVPQAVDQRPLVSKLKEALVEKYGKPIHTHSTSNGYFLFWMKTTNEDPDVIAACAKKIQTLDLAFEPLPHPWVLSRYVNCGTLMNVMIYRSRHDKLDEDVADGFVQTASDASAMMASSNRATAVLEAAKAEARAKELQKASSVQPGKF